MALRTSPSHLSSVDLSVARLVCGKSLARVSSGTLLLDASDPPPLTASRADPLSSTSGRSNLVLPADDSDGNSGSSDREREREKKKEKHHDQVDRAGHKREGAKKDGGE